MDRHTSRKISVLRFLAVASVVVYHAYPFDPGLVIVAPPPPASAAAFVQAFVSLALMRWALPFLGLVSGYLFFRSFAPTMAGYAAKLRSRVRTLLVPFLIWSGLGVLFTVAVTNSPFASESPYWTVHSLDSALDHWLLHPAIYPLWFLQALMTCMVLSPLVYLAVKYLRGWVLLLAAAWWVLGWQPLALWPWVSSTAFPPFLAGAAIALLGWKTPFEGRPRAGVVAALTAAWLAAAALFALYGHELGRWARAGLLPVVVLGICVAWTAGDLARRRAPGRLAVTALYVAPLSFFVYVTQEPALAILKNLAARAPSLPELVAYAVVPAAVITLSGVAALVIRHLLPRTFAVISGGRVPQRQAPAAAGGPAEAPGVAETPGPAVSPGPTDPVADTAV